MNTAEFDTRLRHQPKTSRAEPPPAPSASPGIPITVLSTDVELCEAIRAAAGAQHEVFTAATMEEASQLGAQGQCGILVTDQALSQQSLVRMSKQMRAHDPATITIAVGSRGDDNALIGLLSSAVVERFMLKPVTPALARLVLRSASSEYQSLRSRHRRRASSATASPVAAPAPVESPSVSDPVRVAANVIPMPRVEQPASEQSIAEQPTQYALQPVLFEPPLAPSVVLAEPAVTQSPPKSYTTWITSAVAAIVVGVAVWWTMQQRMPDIDPRQVIATNLAEAAKAFAAGHYAEPAESSALHHYGTVLALDPSNATARQGISQIAEQMIVGVETGIAEGRLAEAGIALERVRRIDPTNKQLSVLEEQLRKEQANQLSMLQARATPAPEAKVALPPVEKAARASEPAKRSVKAGDAKAGATASVAPNTKAPTARTMDPSDPLALGPPAPASSVAKSAEVAGAEIAAAGTALAATAAAVQEPVAKSGEGPAPAPAPLAEPRVTKMVQPEYPSEARMRGIEGWVDLTLSVTPAGDVASAKIEDGKNGRWFDRAALAAVRKWRYESRHLPEGTPAQPVRVRLYFKLEE
ncbi:TonB family protein [Povalibacter uvarum]|uniref:TonB family protein n=1 Tax=Povalibacter uvarum TaxID=732238 RepID=A0A841HQL8_9GAMM|nr:TonB family protein [Povalibacter uvarum]MBB6095507.1 TonB family protein [Povalibacter uvarum]